MATLAEWLNQYNNLKGANFDALAPLGLSPVGGAGWSTYAAAGDSAQPEEWMNQAGGYMLDPALMQQLQGYTVSAPTTDGNNTYFNAMDPSGNTLGQLSTPVAKDNWFDQFGYNGGFVGLLAGAGLMGLGSGAAIDASLGHGAWLGEGVASGIPAWDAATLGALEAGGAAGGAAGLAEALPASYGGGFSPITGPDGAIYSMADAGAQASGGGLLQSLGLGNISPNTLASLGSGALGLFGSMKSADAIKDAGAASNALQKSMFDTIRADQAPYRQAGVSALGQIQSLLKDPSSITQQPDYQFGLNQGTRALDNSAAARGGLYSGQQLKASQRFGQDYAGTKLNESYNRLASIAGIGQQANSQSANAGMNYANQAGNTLQGMGNATGSAYVGGVNAVNNALGGWMQNQQYEDLLKRLGMGG